MSVCFFIYVCNVIAKDLDNPKTNMVLLYCEASYWPGRLTDPL